MPNQVPIMSVIKINLQKKIYSTYRVYHVNNLSEQVAPGCQVELKI